MIGISSDDIFQMPLPQPGRFLACAAGYLTTLSMALQVLISARP